MPYLVLRSLALSTARTAREFSAAALLLASALQALTLCQGCSSSFHTADSGPNSTPGSSAPPGSLSLAPANATVQQWQSIQFTVSGEASNTSCAWTSSDPAILVLIGGQGFQGMQVGNATVSATCGAQAAQAIVAVIPQAASGPVAITSGGTYSGNWNSDDPNTPAVSIETDDPVTIQDSVVASRGTLIRVSGVRNGANVTIENVTGMALDPQRPGAQRGAFVSASSIHSLDVDHCTMTGVSFGVSVTSSNVSALRILNDLAVNLEDRASDGSGGLEAARPALGHFVLLSRIVAPQGGEIAWNQILQTMGQSSVEDVINLFRSQGGPGRPIWVHDNYIEGNSSPSTPDNYTGTAILADGGRAEPVTAQAWFADNEIVHTAGSGLAIDNGHDITASGNRIVSCGQDGAGAWFAMSYANAASIWDFYGSGPSLFYNNTVTETAGGLVRPNVAGEPMAADFWGSALSMTYPGNSSSGNDFTNPCLAGGSLNLSAEDAERAYWAAKVSASGVLIGDQHLGGQ